MSDSLFSALSASPLQSAPQLAAHFGMDRMWIKRDDLIAFAGGGTKCRKFPGLIDRLQATPVDTLLLSGGATSNQARLMAALAATTGYSCEVFLDSPDDAPAAHFVRLFGGTVHALPGASRWTLNAAIRARLRELGAAGKSPVVVPAASPDDLACYEAAIGELVAGEFDLPRNTLFVTAAGSGATSSGFLLGLDRFFPDASLLAVSVDRPAHELRIVITRLLATALGVSPDGDDVARLVSRLTVDDGFIGGGYGMPSAASLEAVALAARSEGLLLEPVYTGKALAALVAMAQGGRIGRDDSVVFWHTGGVPYLAASLAQSSR
ncbi:MAG: pyridoxal-phosphate dependent enzyme [Rhodanobacteraceae bacterium]